MKTRTDLPTANFDAFYSTDESFSSWFHKLSLWLGPTRKFDLPAIELKKNGSGQLSLNEPSIIPFISSRLNITCDLVESMVRKDIEALMSNTVGLFANEFRPPSTITLQITPKQFCISCFSNTLLEKEIPVFDPYWQCAWATHCIRHNTPLIPAELLNSVETRNRGFWYEDGSQYQNWCNRVVSATLSLNPPQHANAQICLNPPSESVIAVNRLFNSPEEASEGCTSLGLIESPELTRHKFYVVFFVLSRRFQHWSVGRDFSRGVTGLGCFPTSDLFSLQILNLISTSQVIQCMEFIAQFIASPDHCFPYLLSKGMKEARIDHFSHANNDCAQLQHDPMIFLCWLIKDTFQSDLASHITKMFPLYAENWQVYYDMLG